MTQIPRHCLHKASGQGFVRLNGRMIYTGKWRSPESNRCYERLISEWLANGRQLAPEISKWELCVDKLVALYWCHAESYYRHDGAPTRELENIRLALRPLVELYGDLPVVDFGPRKLKALREHMVEKGLARTTITPESESCSGCSAGEPRRSTSQGPWQIRSGRYGVCRSTGHGQRKPTPSCRSRRLTFVPCSHSSLGRSRPWRSSSG